MSLLGLVYLTAFSDWFVIGERHSCIILTILTKLAVRENVAIRPPLLVKFCRCL